MKYNSQFNAEIRISLLHVWQVYRLYTQLGKVWKYITRVNGRKGCYITIGDTLYLLLVCVLNRIPFAL